MIFNLKLIPLYTLTRKNMGWDKWPCELSSEKHSNKNGRRRNHRHGFTARSLLCISVHYIGGKCRSYASRSGMEWAPYSRWVMMHVIHVSMQAVLYLLNRLINVIIVYIHHLCRKRSPQHQNTRKKIVAKVPDRIVLTPDEAISCYHAMGGQLTLSLVPWPLTLCLHLINLSDRKNFSESI